MNIKERAKQRIVDNNANEIMDLSENTQVIRDLLAEIKLMQLHIDKPTEGRSEELKHAENVVRQHAAREAINVVTAYMGDTCVSRDLVASVSAYFGLDKEGK